MAIAALQASEAGRRDAPACRFVEGGVTFVVDRSVPEFPGYEWVDDHTVRIHPDAVEAMYARWADGAD